MVMSTTVILVLLLLAVVRLHDANLQIRCHLQQYEVPGTVL